MLIKKLIDEQFLKIILAIVLAYYLGLMFLQYNVKILSLFLLAAFVVLFFKKIEYAFYLLLASRPLIDIFYYQGVSAGGGGSARVGQIVGGGLTVLFVLYLVFYIFHVHRLNIFSLGINKIFGCFLFFSLVSVFFSESIGAGISSWLKMFQVFIILNLTILVVTGSGKELFEKRVNLICWSVVVALIYPFVKFYYNFFSGHGRAMTGYIRYSMFGAHFNIFPYTLLVAFPFCLFLYSVSRSKAGKKIWFAFLGLISYTIFISYTRNVWIGFAILIMVWIIINKKYMLAYAFAGLFVTMMLLNHDIQERLKDIYLVFSSGNFFDMDPLLLSGRIGIWQKNLRYFLDESTLIEKMFGSGYDVYLKIRGYRSGRSGLEHNTYMSLLMNTGVVGLSLYILYIIKLFQEAYRLLRSATDVYIRNYAMVYTAMLVSYVIISSASHMLWKMTFQYYFAVFSGLVIAGNILVRKTGEMENKLVSADRLDKG